MTQDTVELFAVGYAQATALHPVRLTERALRTLEAAVRVSEGAVQPDGVPSLLLGQLEGIWAVIYSRREAIEKLHGGAFKKVLESISKLDWPSIVSAIETQLLIDPSIDGKMLASELRSRISSMIAGDLPAADRAAWNQVMAEALVDGTAEGQTAALGILAHTAGAEFNWELSAQQAKAALSSGAVLGDTADPWIQQQMKGLSYQVSQKLASLWDAGATREEMLAAIQEILGSGTDLASVLLDTAIGQALSMGAVTSYQIAGVPYANFVTAGDSRVCAVCASAEDGNPYQLASTPIAPLHNRCRCTIAPADFFPGSLALVGSEDS